MEKNQAHNPEFLKKTKIYTKSHRAFPIRLKLLRSRAFIQLIQLQTKKTALKKEN